MDILFVFLGLAGISFYHCENLTVEMIKKVGTIIQHYPKRYIVPKRWMRKIFGINQQMVPRYLYYELFVSIAFAVLGPIYLILISCFGKEVGGILILSHMCFVILNTSYIIIRTAIFNRGR